ncbi:hypothetical protein Tco_0052895 [Tanacetum coccineum]
MNPVAAQQVALDNALVSPEKRLKIEKCNARIVFNKPQRETTYQVTLDALKLSPCYLAFLITTEVPKIYMHQFWNTIKKIKDTYAYRFKLDKQKFRIDTKVFLEILQIYPRLPNQDFVEPFPKKKWFHLTRNSGTLNNVDYVALLWEDLMFQPDNREISSARKENMPYPRFTKVIINHFISKDKTISMRNRINLYTVRDDTLLEDEPAKKPKRAEKSVLAKEDVSSKKSLRKNSAGVVIRDTPGVSVSKKKAQTKVDRGKGMDLLSDVALLEVA